MPSLRREVRETVPEVLSLYVNLMLRVVPVF